MALFAKFEQLVSVGFFLLLKEKSSRVVEHNLL
jgi:hypothetical protein